MMRPLILFTCLVLLGGCSPWVNIPAQRGDLASHDPNTSTVHKAVTVALKHTLEQYPPAGAYAVIMPEGASTQTMAKLNAALPEGAGATADATGRIPVYRVASIRIRGWDGQVDIIPPAGLRPKRLLSVYLDHDLSGWYVRRTHLWNMPLERALQLARPAPRYEAPPVVEPQPEPIPEADMHEHAQPDAGEPQFIDENQPIEITPQKDGVKWEQ